MRKLSWLNFKSEKFWPNKPTHVTNSLTKLDFHVDVDVNVNVNVNANVGVNVDVKNKFYWN